MRNNKLLWKCCVIAVVAVIVITLSPLVIKTGKTNPFLLGLPYTLWTGILMTILLVFLTFIGGIVMPKDGEGEE